MIFGPELCKSLFRRNGLFLPAQVGLIAPICFFKPSPLYLARVRGTSLLDAIKEPYDKLCPLVDGQRKRFKFKAMRARWHDQRRGR